MEQVTSEIKKVVLYTYLQTNLVFYAQILNTNVHYILGKSMRYVLGSKKPVNTLISDFGDLQGNQLQPLTALLLL